MLNPKSIEEFKKIIFQEYEIELTNEQAYQDATAFLEVFKILIVDTPREENGNVS